MDVTQRESDIIYMTTALSWMEQAFKDHSGDVAKMVNSLGATFARILQSYESEIECLKHALPADKPIQTNSTHVPVDSVEV